MKWYRDPKHDKPLTIGAILQAFWEYLTPPGWQRFLWVYFAMIVLLIIAYEIAK